MAAPKKNYPLTQNTINVIEIVDLLSMSMELTAFPANESGVKDAEALFRKLIADWTEGIDDEDFDNCLEDGYFREADYYVCIVHSTPYPAK